MNTTVKKSGGALLLLLSAVDQFHAEHGFFPNVVELPKTLIDEVLNTCLTPAGVELLRKQLDLREGVHNAVTAFGRELSTQCDLDNPTGAPSIATAWIGLGTTPQAPVLPLRPLEAASQIVYVLTNPAMPGLVKIGKTTQREVEERMKQLFGTGVPVPFDCAFACQVKDAHEVERALHFAFGNARINPNREFFKIEPERVIAVLKLLKVDDVTQQIEQQIEAEVTSADKESAQHMKDRRPRMKFYEIGIPEGSVLISRDGAAEATVVSDRKVLFQGEVQSLTSATRKVLGLPEDYSLQPSPYWTFNGTNVNTLYQAFHASDAG